MHNDTPGRGPKIAVIVITCAVLFGVGWIGLGIWVALAALSLAVAAALACPDGPGRGALKRWSLALVLLAMAPFLVRFLIAAS